MSLERCQNHTAHGLEKLPFRCAHCHYSCNISGSLKRHYNRKHPNEEYANVGTGELAAEVLIQQGVLLMFALIRKEEQKGEEKDEAWSSLNRLAIAKEVKTEVYPLGKKEAHSSLPEKRTQYLRVLENKHSSELSSLQNILEFKNLVFVASLSADSGCLLPLFPPPSPPGLGPGSSERRYEGYMVAAADLDVECQERTEHRKQHAMV
ncbi:hypothetical protein P7K49_026455 [Saguinus oedipus]|uniref:C2H2-type domain-containing protein n=1 Tax=Saguinus oedipus TaxID=9490 RepID=A0ABQ9UD77_SAGOE|nr:hypothetical protein P7K49_026455 [Saguinus oedipus]